MTNNISRVQRSAIPNARFSIVIPSWNNLPYLQLCIKSIRQNSHFINQIIVHINDGKDGSLEWIKGQHDIDYSHSPENIGICYPLNFARSLMSTDYLVYLNDDMYVCPGWDQVLYDEIAAVGHNMFFISGSAIEPGTQNPCYINGHYGTSVSDFKEEELLKEFHTYKSQDWLGATWPPNVVHKEVWDLVGGYSTEFSPGMYSDPDFSIKLWKLGVRLFKGVNQCRVYHFGSKSTLKVTKNKGYYTFIGKWGMTSGTFTRHFLKQGQPFDGPLKDFVLPFSLRVKNFIKRLAYSFKARF